MILQSLFKTTVAVSTIFTIPSILGFWEHMLPHVDVMQEERDREREEERRAVQEYKDECLRAEARREYKEWVDALEAKWAAEDAERDRQWFGSPPDRDHTACGYEGTCGPPDRDK